MEYTSINNGESGLVIRNKINNMFSALITGKQSVNEVWKQITQLISDLETSGHKVDDLYNELKEQVLNSFSYTDTSIEDLRIYINGINGGISGFAVDTSFKPDFPEDKAATVLAAGAGTYINMLDVNGNPITITEPEAIIIFYKGADSTYWKYKTVLARVVIDENIDGGNAFTFWGGSKNIDGGRAQLE